LIDITKGVCPYCLEENIPSDKFPAIFASFSVGSSGRLYLCKQHFQDLVEALNQFYKKDESGGA